MITTPHAPSDFPPPVIHRHEHAEDWIAAGLAQLHAAIASDRPQRLLLSGGTTPAPLYAALAVSPGMDWNRLTLGLVDERWLPDDDANRNDHLIKTHLLDRQPLARLQPLAQRRLGLDASADAANDWWSSGPVPAAAVLGMGNDGHTASLFPGAPDLARSAASLACVSTFDASGCRGAQHWPRRLTLTPKGLSSIATRLLMLRGQDKLDTLQRALSGNDAAQTPILYALPGPSPLQVHWCP